MGMLHTNKDALRRGGLTLILATQDAFFRELTLLARNLFHVRHRRPGGRARTLRGAAMAGICKA